MVENSYKEERYPSILILDFGSQYSELIARRIRENNVYSLVVTHQISSDEIKLINPDGIILSGGPSSVYENHAPLCDADIFVGCTKGFRDSILRGRRDKESI